MESILQQFLSAQIINIDEDDNHAKLVKAAADLTKIITKDKTKFQQIAITAVDPSIDIDDPNIIEVKDLIIKHWSTFINKSQNTPLTYIRAVMLESLLSLCSQDDFASIVWLTTGKPVAFYETETRESKILQDFLTICGNRYEKLGLENWSVSNSVATVTMPVIKAVESKKMGGIKSDYVSEKMAPAVMNGNAISQNPSYGASNVRQEWANEFARLTGEAFNAVFTTIVKQANEALDSKANSESFQAFVENFNKEASSVLNNVIYKSASIELRGQLLWFKEALYSNTQKNSYRKLATEISAVALPAEFSKMLPEFCPISVEYFITETFLSANTKSEELISFQTLLDYLMVHKDKLASYFSNFQTIKPGRLTLMQFIGYLVNGLLTKESFLLTTGLSPSLELSWSDLSIWLYREFQANKLVVKK